MLARATAEIPYRLRLAETAEDLRAAQTLRFLVFNLELNEGLESSFSTLRDEDPFDAICDHLLVENKTNGEIVGTYRLQSGSVAMKNRGFYSEQEFDFTPFRPIHEQIVELGRACVHSDHRSLPVIGLLWQGISDYARQVGARYLVGRQNIETAAAVVWGALGVFVGIGFAAFGGIIQNGTSPAAAFFGEFVPAAGSNLINVVILLPIVLTAWNAARARSGR